MSEAVRKRVAIAKRVGTAFKALREVQAGCVTGSVALGLADDESDLDLTFVCSPGPPTHAARCALYRKLSDHPRSVTVDVDGPNTFDYLEIDGVRVEPEFHTLETLKGRISTALQMGSRQREESDSCSAHLPHWLLGDVHYWDILFEKSSIVSEMKQRVRFSDELRRSLLQQGRFWDDPHLIHEHERASLRCDTVYALRCLSKIVDYFVQTVFALNRTFYPGEKWALHFIKKFDRVPKGFHEQFIELTTVGNDRASQERRKELVRALFRGLRVLVKGELASAS